MKWEERIADRADSLAASEGESGPIPGSANLEQDLSECWLSVEVVG
jgi:hypothetical protein